MFTCYDVLLLTFLLRVTQAFQDFLVNGGLLHCYRHIAALDELTNRCAINILASNIDRNNMVHVIDRLLAYFENTWIGQPVGGQRLPPLFPHHMWNVRDRSGTGSSRTTNALEAFYHTYNSLLTCQHPTIWKLLESLESQQNLSRRTIFGRGDSFRPSEQERRRNESIPNLVSSYTQAAADDLLRGMAYNYMM